MTIDAFLGRSQMKMHFVHYIQIFDRIQEKTKIFHDHFQGGEKKVGHMTYIHFHKN